MTGRKDVPVRDPRPLTPTRSQLGSREPGSSGSKVTTRGYYVLFETVVWIQTQGRDTDRDTCPFNCRGSTKTSRRFTLLTRPSTLPITSTFRESDHRPYIIPKSSFPGNTLVQRYIPPFFGMTPEVSTTTLNTTVFPRRKMGVSTHQTLLRVCGRLEGDEGRETT